MKIPHVHRQDGWILFDAPASRSAAWSSDPAALLVATAHLPGGCKFALARGEAPLRVRAEIPEAAGSPERLQAVEAGFYAAGELDRGSPRSLIGEAGEPTSGRSDTRTDLPSLCSEIGWPFEERDDGLVSVDLVVSGAYVPACLRADAMETTVEAEIGTALPKQVDPCRTALATFLLRTNAASRMARAAARPGVDGDRVVLEVQLPGPVGSNELREVLGALAVAAQRCAREARLLATDTALALDYASYYSPHRGC